MHRSLAQADLLAVLHNGHIASGCLAGQDEIARLGHRTLGPDLVNRFGNSKHLIESEAALAYIGRSDQGKSGVLRRGRPMKTVNEKLADAFESRRRLDAHIPSSSKLA